MVSNRRQVKLLKRAAMCARLAGKRSPFRLLDLPVEVRRMILRELLWDPEPIFFHGPTTHANPILLSRLDRWGIKPRSETLHPNVLRACKQLYREGAEILYDNTIKCVLGYDTWQHCDHPGIGSCIFLGRQYTKAVMRKSYLLVNEPPPPPLPSGLQHRVRKLRLEVIAGPFCFDPGFPHSIPRWLRDAVIQIAEFLERQKQYTQLTLSLKVSSRGPEEENAAIVAAEEAREQTHERHELGFTSDLSLSTLSSSSLSDVLEPDSFTISRNRAELRLFRPLVHLRDRLHISIDGVDPLLKRQLVVMTTKTPAVNLHAMYERLSHGLFQMFQGESMDMHEYGHYLQDLLSECEDACNEGHFETFLRLRGKIISIIAMEHLNHMRYLTADDSDQVPSFWRGPYVATTKDLVRQGTDDDFPGYDIPRGLGAAIEKYRLYSEHTNARSSGSAEDGANSAG